VTCELPLMNIHIVRDDSVMVMSKLSIPLYWFAVTEKYLYILATLWHSTTELMQGDLAVSCKLMQHHNAKLSQIDAVPWPSIVIIDSTLGFSLIPTVPLPSLLTQEHDARSLFETSQSTVENHSLHIDAVLLSVITV